MTTVHDFSKIVNIDGVKSYYLVKFDGTGIAFQGENADTIFPFVAFSGLNCDAISPLLGFSKFKHIIFTRENREDVIAFSLSNYFLAVIKEADAPATDLVQSVSTFIQAIISENVANQSK